VTTYEEWRVTGRPAQRIPGLTPLLNAEDAYQWTWSPPRGHPDPETTARLFTEAARAAADWTDGPHLHKRTVTVTDWEDVEL
jgi:hypothetical protein